MIVCTSGPGNSGNGLHGQPLMVVAILNEPLLNSEQESDSSYYREPLDPDFD